MKVGFGIAGLVIAILGIFSPLTYSLYVGAAALILVSIGALAGERALAVATALIVAANLFLFSPVTMAWLTDDGPHNGRYLWVVIIIFLAMPFIAIALNASGKVVLGTPPESKSD